MPLLFFKRICDTWDDKYLDIVEESGDEQLAWFPEPHRFQIPEDCHWDDVRAKASNIGAAMQRTLGEIEKFNSDALYGVLVMPYGRIQNPIPSLNLIKIFAP